MDCQLVSPTAGTLGGLEEGLEPNLLISEQPKSLSDTLARAIENGHAKLTKGDLDDAQRFFSYFDPPNPDPVNLADR
jgi:hypothetical protein